MPVRKMKQDDIHEVSRIVVAAFSNAVAGDLSDEGIYTFRGLSAPEAFAKRMNEDNLIFVYEEHNEIMGMIELKKGQHLAMLFVSPDKQRRGIGHELVQVALQHRRAHSITVSASLPSVPAYEKYGFEVTGPEEETGGLRYIPIKIELSTDSYGSMK